MAKQSESNLADASAAVNHFHAEHSLCNCYLLLLIFTTIKAFCTIFIDCETILCRHNHINIPFVVLWSKL